VEVAGSVGVQDGAETGPRVVEEKLVGNVVVARAVIAPAVTSLERDNYS